LVTGASGFIGGEVCRLLTETGAEVHGVGLQHPPPPDVHGHRADLATDAWPLLEEVQPAVILHMASPVSMSHEEGTHSRLRPGIVDATAAIGQGACKLDAQMVHISSCAVYEGCTAPFGEDLALSPSSPYGALKLESEEEVLRLVRTGLRATILRPFRTYGAGCLTDLVAEACKSAVQHQPLALTSGTQVREWNHVHSIAVGIVQAAQLRPTAQIINLGGGDRVSVVDLARRIYRLAGANEHLIQVGLVAMRPQETHRFWGDHRHAEARWGPLPQIPLNEGLRQTLQWHKETSSVAR